MQAWKWEHKLYYLIKLRYPRLSKTNGISVTKKKKVYYFSIIAFLGVKAIQTFFFIHNIEIEEAFLPQLLVI